MPKLLRLRVLSEEEEEEITHLARSRTAPVRLVERARIIERARQGLRVPAIAAAVGVSEPVVRTLAAPLQRARAGGADRRAARGAAGDVPAGAGRRAHRRQPDQSGDLGLPFGSWTLDRLAAYLHESKASP